MIKLPLLQPHLTSSQGTDGKTGSWSKYSPFFSSGRLRGEADAQSSGGGGIRVEVRDWESQAQDITVEVANSDKYKSLALAADVRLAEALERCARLAPPTHTASGEQRPSKLKTAVCCQLLGEFAELCGPFGGALKSIRDELVGCLYSTLYSSERGTLSYDQLPWFTVAERLEAEKEVMLEEKKRFTQMLEEQQEVIARIEQQMVSYQRSTEAAQTEARDLRSRLEGLVASEELARTEARTGREELKRVRKEWLRLRDEYDAEKDAHRKLKETSDQDSSAAKAQIMLLQDALHSSQAELHDARQQLSVRLPAEAVAGLREQVKELADQAASYKKRADALEAKLTELQSQTGSMTPRPSWRALKRFGVDEGAQKRTQDLVAAAAEKLASYSLTAQACAARALDLELCVAEDPRPTEITLAIATDMSAYFITESDGSGGIGARAPATVSAEGLGRGPHVPRCLRRRAGTMVTGIQPLSQEQTEALCCHIWQSKQVHEALHPPQHLQSYLYTYYTQQLSPGVNTLAGGGPTGSAFNSAPPGALHYAITQHAYCLYHSLAQHSRASPIVRMFREMLFGQLPEGVHSQQKQVFSALLAIAQEAAVGASRAASPENGEPAGAPAAPTVPTLAMLDALQRLCAGLPGYKVSRLKEAYMQSIGPVSAALSTLQGLLEPFAGQYDAQGVLRELQRHHASVSAAVSAEQADEEAEGVDSLRRMSSWSMQKGGGMSQQQAAAAGSALDAFASVPLAMQPPSVVACTSNAFVSTLLGLILEHHESIVSAVTKEVAALASQGPAAAGAAGPHATGSRAASPSPHDPAAAAPASRSVTRPSTAIAGSEGQLTAAERDVLGATVSTHAIAEALQAAGLTPPQAAGVLATLMCGTGSACLVQGEHIQRIYTKGSVWAGQAALKLLCEACVTVRMPKMFPDVQGMLNPRTPSTPPAVAM